MIKKNIFLTVAKLIALSAIIVLYVVKCVDLNFVQDDAYTTFRYIKNFIEGNGLVFNTCEYVEGYTNFLWIVILTPFYSANISIDLAAQILSISFGVLSLIITFIFTGNLLNKIVRSQFIFSKLSSLITVYLLMMSGGFSYWGASGMETTLFVFLITTGIYFYVKKYNAEKINYPFVISFVLAALTRPEGILIFALIITHKIFYNLCSHTSIPLKDKFKGLLSRKNILEITLFLVPIIIHTAFRLIYYGYPFPNTYYAKVGISGYYLSRGLNYFLNFLESYMLFGILLVSPLLLIKTKEIRFEVTLFCLLIFSYIIYIVLIGGDVLPINRFFLPILPLIYLLVVLTVVVLLNKYTEKKITVYLINLAALIMLVSFSIFISAKEEPRINEMLAYEKGLVKKMGIYADWVKDQQNTQNRKMTVALSTIGAFSYLSDSKVIDLIGLTDEYIAHHNEIINGIPEDFTESWKERRQNSSYILRVRPDFIIFPAGAKPSAFAESALFANKQFNYRYYPQLIYSEQLNQMLPIFTLKNSKQLAASDSTIFACNCDISFIKNYVNASNMFLKYLVTKDGSMLYKIEAECNEVIKKCEFKKADALTLLGFTFYHSGGKAKAKSYFQQAEKLDSFNSSVHLYLKTLYFEEGDLTNAYHEMRLLKELSPYAIPDPLRKSY
ncbi:MAG: hypothetical protein V1720_21625 [bacterium]